MGLMGYNGVLCALALGGKTWKSFVQMCIRDSSNMENNNEHNIKKGHFDAFVHAACSISEPTAWTKESK